ncbi:MAG: lectin-like protein [Planctomycetota bacterium]
MTLACLNRRCSTTVLAFGIALAASAPRASADFNYPDFASVADLTLNGDAAQSGIVLRLTPDISGQAGSAWYTTTKQHVSDGFDTTFGIRMTGGMSGDGMAFVIQDESTTALGAGGSDLGYGGISRSIAIEFDTFGFFPETDNHISIQTRGLLGNDSSDQYSLVQVNVQTDLNDGQRHDFLIRYRPGVLLVFLDGSDVPTIDIALDLQNLGGDNILDGSGDAWVGFTAGTGFATENHDVEFWSFDEAAFPLPSGPCCTLGGCVIATQHDCKTLLNGFFAGPINGDCGSTICTGACCTGDLCEDSITLTDCTTNGGTFMGVNVICNYPDFPTCTGACCDTIGVCFITSQSDCELNYLGTFHGAGTSCVPFPCSMPSIGACCNNSNECLQMTESDCANLPGIWYGLGTNCLDVDCFGPPPALGACCQPGNTCVDSVSQTVCTHFNGVYQGDASLCVNSNCSGACDWNAATDFSSVSNPTGPWSYGSRASLNDASLAVYSSFTTSLPFSQSGPLSIWYIPDVSPFGVPFVLKNESATNVTIDSFPQVIVPAGRMMLHPGPSAADEGVDSFSVVRWTAPVAGTFQVSATFYGMDIGDTDVHIVHNGTSIFDDVRSGVGDNRSFAGTVTVAAGDTLDFVVGRNGDESFDSTGLDVCIAVPQACDCQNATPLPDNSFFNDSTVGAPICDGSPCAGPSPAKIYSFSPSQSGFGLINTCNGSNFDSVISVHSSCPMTPANQIACDLNTCGLDAQVYFCVTSGQTYYVRVGGEGGSSGDYTLLAVILVADIFEGPLQNPGNGHWYYHTTQGPWTSLEQLAISKGGNLVTINDAAENEWVRARFAEGTAVSIGINDAAAEGTFAWASGQPVTYTNWELGEPNDTDDQDYGLMLSEGVWRDETSCFAGLYRGVIEVTTVPLPAILAGPITNPANCHQYYITQTGTWIEGELKAQSIGGNLVTIDDAAENEFVRATFANYGGQPHNVWIGLSDVAVENTFTWADGSPVGYTAWNPGEPNNIGNEDYVVMNDAVTGGWNDAHSGGPFYAVIEVPMNCPCTCRGDLTGDAAVRGTDIRQFIACFLAANGGSPTLGCQCADVNNDGLVTSADISAMATAALNGPACPP